MFTILQKQFGKVIINKKRHPNNSSIDAPKNHINTYIKSLFITSCTLFLTWSINPIFYETNDDTGIMAFVAGFKTGTPTPGTIFCNVIWGGVISCLYRLNSSISWYVLAYMLLTLLSLSVLCHSCMNIFSKDIKQSISILIFLWFYLAIFFFHCVGFQFTTMSAICGMGSIIIAHYPFENDGNFKLRKADIGRILLFILLFIFSCNIRPKIGYMACLGLFFSYIINRYLFRYQISKLYLYIGGIISVLSYITNRMWEHINKWEAFRLYHIQRALWTDYSHISFHDNPELYQSVGWSENLYNLAGNWFFIDENINDRTFTIINEATEHIRQTFSIKQQIINSLQYLFNLDKQTKIVVIYLIVIMLWVLFNVMSMKAWHILWGLCVYVSLGFLFLFYFAWKGRLVYRVTDSTIFLFFVPGIVFTLKTLFNNQADKITKQVLYINKGKLLVLIAFFTVGILFSIISPSGLAQMTHLNAISESRRNNENLKEKLEQYAIQNQKNLYIYENSLGVAGNPFTTYPERKPYNLMFWGGSGMYSPLYYEQLRANGFQTLYPEDFFRNNVYFLAGSEPSEILINYMSDKFENCDCQIIDRQEGFIVYQFTRNGE